jgi:dTDP-glucose 4,6-dehydratase
MSRRILVTGSAGFLGAHFVDAVLKDTDWEIVGIDSFKHRGDSLRVYQDPSRYSIITHDLTTPISARMIEKIGKIDMIFSIASDSHVDRSITDPVPFVENNVKLILNLLEYTRVAKPSLFLHVSTDEVYGPALDGTLHKEWNTILPSNPYSASKAAQEAIIIATWRTFGVKAVIVNSMNLTGERQDREKYIPMLISKIQKGEVVTIHGTPEYIGKRFYIHCRNLSDAILFLARKNPTEYSDSISEIIVPDRYNIVGELELNNLELAQMVADILGKELKFEYEDFHKTRPGHDRRYALDGAKIAELGWKIPVGFKQSLEKTVLWTIDHPEWLV